MRWELLTLMNTGTGERTNAPVVRRGPRAVYVALGVYGYNKPCGFFVATGKPVPSNPYKNLVLERKDATDAP